MKWTAPIITAALFLLASPAMAQYAGDPDQTCKFTLPVTEITSVKQLPLSIVADLGTLIDRGAAFPIVRRGQPQPAAPTMRLLRAGTYQGKWVVWLEGDRYYSKNFHYYLNGPTAEAYRVVTFTGGIAPDVCARTAAFLGPKARDTSKDAAMKPNWNCSLSRAALIYNSTTQLPMGLINAMGGYVADRGEKFDLTRASDSNLPQTRFIRAGKIGSQYFVWREVGGYMHAVNIALYDEPMAGAPRLGIWPRYVERVSINEDLTGDLCSRTDLLLNGYPPRPAPPLPR